MRYASALLLLFLAQEPATTPSAPEACTPCAAPDHPQLALARLKLEEAFRLSMSVLECNGETRAQCIDIETRLSDAFEALRIVVGESQQGGAIDCLGCDPAVYVAPLFGSFRAVADLLVSRGHDDFIPELRAMEQDLTLWEGYGCCQARSTRKRSRSREMEARTALAEKCGANFERNRSGLRQVVRIPGDRQGCYQSRACRDATEHKGRSMEAGYWTYDGEYWYVWAQRRTPRGEWTTCDG